MAYEVTIGIPVYNVAKYIRMTMDSALAQTSQGIEFLVVDDCGTDGSIDIVREYQQRHPRGQDIRILTQPCNMGIGAARNRMMAEAQGKFFYSLDADDCIAENAIELLYDAAMKHRAELVYGSYDRVKMDEDGRVTETESCHYPLRMFSEPDAYAEYAYNVGVQGMNWNYLIATDIVRRNGLKVAEVGHGYGEDFTFTIDLPTYADRVVLLPDITYHYYIRSTDRHRQKKVLSREHMARALKAIDEKKRRDELRERPYYSKRMAALMLIDCSFACEMLGRRRQFDKPFSNEEIRRTMWHPMSLREIVSSKPGRMANLLYWFIGILPPSLCVLALGLMLRRYGVKNK